MINVWDVISKLIHFPKMFLSMDILLEQQMGQFIINLHYEV